MVAHRRGRRKVARRGTGGGWRREAAEGLLTLARAMAVAFAALLAMAAAALAAGDEGLANQLAAAAYYALVTAVASLIAYEALAGSQHNQRE